MESNQEFDQKAEKLCRDLLGHYDDLVMASVQLDAFIDAVVAAEGAIPLVNVQPYLANATTRFADVSKRFPQMPQLFARVSPELQEKLRKEFPAYQATLAGIATQLRVVTPSLQEAVTFRFPAAHG